MSSFGAQVIAAQIALSRGAESGQKKAAASALNNLRELLATGPTSRDHAATLCNNRLRLLRLGRGESGTPTWDGVISRVLFYLSLGSKLSKCDVEKLRHLVGAAISSGVGALSGKAELKVFCYVCRELANLQRTPLRADKQSAHSECISVLLQLTSARPYLATRLAPLRLRALLESCMEWIGSGPCRAGVQRLGDEGISSPGNDKVVGSAGKESRRAAPHETIAALPQLMVQYAHLVHSLVLAWLADMPVVEPCGEADDSGPFCSVLSFLSRVCVRRPTHFPKMANLLWSAMLSAIVVHGANALHEVAAFGLQPSVHAALLSEWNTTRGASLADSFATFVRAHLSCVGVCDLGLPTTYARQLSRLVFDELVHATAIKRTAGLLDVHKTSEEMWRARSLMQLITDVIAVHRPQWSALSADVEAAPSKRLKTTASMALGQHLSDNICVASSAASTGCQHRWLLLFGSICERNPSSLTPLVRSTILSALSAHLRTVEASIGILGGAPLIAWSLGNLASIEPSGAASSEWDMVWLQLHTLAVLHETTITSQATRIQKPQDLGGTYGNSVPGTGWERPCFVDLATRCMCLALTQRLLSADVHAVAVRTLHTSVLFSFIDDDCAIVSAAEMTKEADATDAPIAAVSEGVYLQSVAELASALYMAADCAHTNDVQGCSHPCPRCGNANGLQKLTRWLCECMQRTPLHAAFESVAPWRCALQLCAQNSRALGSEQTLLRTIFCRVAVPDATCFSTPGPCSFAAKASSFRPSYPCAGMDSAPPIPIPWLRRLAPPAPAPAEDEYTGHDMYESYNAVPSRLLAPGMLQLEVFLRHVESLSSTTPSNENSIGCADYVSVPTAPAPVTLHSAAASEHAIEARLVTKGDIVNFALCVLHGQMKCAMPRYAISGASDQATFQSVTHALRVAEWTAELMLGAGPRRAPPSCVKLIQTSLRRVASWLRRKLPSASVAGDRSTGSLGATATMWARAYDVLLSLRSCLFSCSCLTSEKLGHGFDSWSRGASSWPEPLYASMGSESQTLVGGVELLCGRLTRRKHPAYSADVATGSSLGVMWYGGIDDVEIDMGYGCKLSGINTEDGSSASAARGLSSFVPSDEGAHHLEDDDIGSLQVVLECIDLWARSETTFAVSIFSHLTGALASIQCAPLHSRTVALRALSACARATPGLQKANSGAWVRLNAESHVTTGQGSWLEPLKPWLVQTTALLGDTKSRLARAASRVRKLKLDDQSTINGAANVEASAASATSSCDCSLRQALAALAAFARSAPAVLPLGGSAREFLMYNEAWQLIVGRGDSDAKAVVTERGRHASALRDVQRMLPLTPSARVALVDALRAHVAMYAHLHNSLRRFRSQPPQVPCVRSSNMETALR